MERPRYADVVLRVVFIDTDASPELLGELELLVNEKGKPLTVLRLPRDADASSAQTYQAVLHAGGRRVALRECLLLARESDPKPLAVLRFDDEAELPLLVASRIAARSCGNVQSALTFYLRMRQALELSSMTTAASGEIAFRGRVWRATAGEQLAELSDVLVPLPVEGVVALRADGGVGKVTVSEPSPDAVAEARSYIASLVQHGQVDTHIRGQHARATHEIVTDAQGLRRLVRMRS